MTLVPSHLAIALSVCLAFTLACTSEDQPSDAQAGSSEHDASGGGANVGGASTRSSDVSSQKGGAPTGGDSSTPAGGKSSDAVSAFGGATSSTAVSASAGGTSSIAVSTGTGGTSSIAVSSKTDVSSGGKSTKVTSGPTGGRSTTGAAVGGSSSTKINGSGGSAPVSRGGASASTARGGASATGGSSNSSSSTSPCEAANLVWKTANKTNYTSHPDPGSEECIVYSGCEWAGQFAACDDTKPEAWVSSHNIVAAFPDFNSLELHDLCLRKGSKTIVVTVLDTCGDSDCDGCCTKNKGSAQQLIDVESYTNARWGVADGPIEWADLGPTKTQGCQ